MAKPRGLYTPVYASLPRHAKVQRAADALRCDRHKLLGHLVTFWTWCLDGAPDGAVLTASVVALGAEWSARGAQVFADALADAGLLERVDGGYLVHEWSEYGGKVASLQVKDRERHSSSSSAEVPQSFHGSSSLDETRRDETRSDIPNPTDSAPSKARPLLRVFTSDDKDQMRLRYGSVATVAEIDEQIELALAHKALKKTTRQDLYVNNWLRKSFEGRNGRRAGGGAGVAPQSNFGRAGGQGRVPAGAAGRAAVGRPSEYAGAF